MTDALALKRLDAGTAWVLTKTKVLATRDAGGTWTSAENPCTRPQPGWEGPFLSGPMTFADGEVGWIGRIFPMVMGASAGALYGTSDGGATWHLIAFTPQANNPLPDGVGMLPAGVADLHFFSETDGDRMANAAARASHHRDLIFKSHEVGSISSRSGGLQTADQLNGGL